jgi:hypothetical protein
MKTAGIMRVLLQCNQGGEDARMTDGYYRHVGHAAHAIVDDGKPIAKSDLLRALAKDDRRWTKSTKEDKEVQKVFMGTTCGAKRSQIKLRK